MPRKQPSPREQAAALSDLPPDELLRYGLELGLDLDQDIPPEEMIRRIRARHELLIDLDRDALLDVIVWSRSPVRRSASKDQLAREIARAQRTNYQSLSRRGLVALARLRGIAARESDNAEELIARLRKRDGFWNRLTRKRRSLAASFVTRLLTTSHQEGADEYRFLPEEAAEGTASDQESLKTQIEEHGVVGGLASRLRGAADDYVHAKLEEIEARIDAKLDAIDQRLAEWRDREVANRLKILRITLIFTVLVAVLSLGYKMLNARCAVVDAPETGQKSQPL
jgi:hypothetical protein